MMAATFRSVNTPLSPAASLKEESIASPTTPKPTTAPHTPPTKPMDDATTPTRASFPPGALALQKPLPTSPFPESVQVPEPTAEKKTPRRENSQLSRQSKDSDDMDMDDSDKEAGDDGAASDDESVNADGTGSSKKKKSQRFYCTDYPPCNLSFTRSEHLARHIRKHTGERPFQCHCSRRFSRLDNLRQHAQTVHVNEDIPVDSLAATGTRFQRQIRTERVRQVTGRARASTGGSVGPVGRGHAKSLSTSSITSVSSLGSNYSANEARRRPPPLVMADPRARGSLESYRGPDGPYYRPASPSDFSTPTSATFSTGHSSPRWGSGVASPISSHSRSHSMYTGGSRTPGRRLSVPSGGNPFQSPHSGASVRGPLFPGGMNASNSGAFSPGQGNLLASPASASTNWSSSAASSAARRDSASMVAADEAWRRRTWHPDTRDYNGASRLSQVITPAQMQQHAANHTNTSTNSSDTIPPPVVHPVLSQTQQQQQQQPAFRLPGIESFGPLMSHRPASPPQRKPSPMLIDSEMRNAPPPMISVAEIPPPAAAAVDREAGRNVPSQWDMNLHRGLTRLDINTNNSNSSNNGNNHTPPRDLAGAWASEVSQAVLARAGPTQQQQQQVVRFDAEVKTMPGRLQTMGYTGAGPRHQHTMSAPSITSRESKRHGWYHGPVTVHSPAQAREREMTIHENHVGGGGLGGGSGVGGGGRPHVDRIVHPNVGSFAGFPAREPQQQQGQQEQQRGQGQGQGQVVGGGGGLSSFQHHGHGPVYGQGHYQQHHNQNQHQHQYQSGSGMGSGREGGTMIGSGHESGLGSGSGMGSGMTGGDRSGGEKNAESLRRLEALVAVATSESSTAAAY